MIVPKKSLGQNFLRDENIARNIVERLALRRDDFLLEIGPGTGALTAHLVDRVERMMVVEIDPRAVEVLRERFPGQLEIVQRDILDIDAAALAKSVGGPIRAVGNIPYYITSEILFWAFDSRQAFRDVTIMMQLDLARRLTAKRRTKDYGILSVVAQCYSKPEILLNVSRNSFYPIPNVDSAVVRLTLKTDVHPHDESLFRAVVRGTFGKRRKTLYNGLRFMGFTGEQLDNIAFDLKRRPEELGVEDFLELTKLLEGEIPVRSSKFETRNTKQIPKTK